MNGAAVYIAGQRLAGESGVTSYLRKYHEGGREEWTIDLPGFFSTGEGSGPVAADAGGVYVATSTELNGTDDPSAMLAPPGVAPYLRRYDPNGNQLWTMPIEFASTVSTNAVAVDASAVYLGGTLSSPEAVGGFVAKLMVP